MNYARSKPHTHWEWRNKRCELFLSSRSSRQIHPTRCVGNILWFRDSASLDLAFIRYRTALFYLLKKQLNQSILFFIYCINNNSIKTWCAGIRLFYFIVVLIVSSNGKKKIQLYQEWTGNVVLVRLVSTNSYRHIRCESALGQIPLRKWPPLKVKFTIKFKDWNGEKQF